MLKISDYVEYLLHTPFNYTCTNLADHKVGVSHDVISDFLRTERLTPAQLFEVVRPHIKDSDDSVIIADDSVQDKRYSKMIELVKKQYSGNVGGLVRGINLLNFVHSGGLNADFWPIDYRIYHPDSDGKTKNDHFRELFTRLLTHKDLKAKTILFDSWYASVENLKHIHRAGWTFFTTLKSNRQVSLSKESGRVPLSDLVFDEDALASGITIKLKDVPFLIKLFKIVAPNGDIDWAITNSPDQSVNVEVAKAKSHTRWQVEEFHRGFKQLTGSEKCQCRKARSQRNHLACCYRAWTALKVKARECNKTIYWVRKNLFSDFLTQKLANPDIKAL